MYGCQQLRPDFIHNPKNVCLSIFTVGALGVNILIATGDMKCSEFIWVKSSSWQLAMKHLAFFSKKSCGISATDNPDDLDWCKFLQLWFYALQCMLVTVGCAVLLPAMGPYCHHHWSFTHLPLPNWEKQSSLLKNMHCMYICKHKTENGCVRNQITN